MKNERKLISQNNDLFNQICADLYQFQPVLNKLKSSYESLEIGPFTNIVLKEIAFSGTQNISKKYNETIQEEIAKTGATKSIIKNNIISGSEIVLNEFVEHVKMLKNFKPDTFTRAVKLDLKNISFTEKGFVLSAEDKENILEENCRLYLENEEEHKLYDNLTNLISAYNTVKANLDEVGCVFTNYKESISTIETMFLTGINGKHEIKGSMISWALNQKSYRERMSKEIKNLSGI